MIFIDKRNAPEWYISLQTDNTSIRKYKDLQWESRQRLRQELVEEQLYICGYCCGRIDEDSAQSIQSTC